MKFHIIYYSDAGSTGLASVYKENSKLHMSKKNFNFVEETKSSTWRELEAVRYSLDSMKNLLRNKHVKWHTDNYAAGIIVKSGSNKRDLQELSIKTFNITFKHNIKFDISWIPRTSNNELAEKISKTIDYDDWYVTPHLFKMLTVRRWGVATIIRFASEKNRKTMRFNSKHLCRGTLVVDAFAFDWTGEFNRFVLPAYLIGKTIKHFCSSKTGCKAVLVCPYWTSAAFWPLIVTKFNSLQKFVKDYFIIEDARRHIKLGDYKKSYICSENFKGSFIAFYMEK